MTADPGLTTVPGWIRAILAASKSSAAVNLAPTNNLDTAPVGLASFTSTVTSLPQTNIVQGIVNTLSSNNGNPPSLLIQIAYCVRSDYQPIVYIRSNYQNNGWNSWNNLHSAVPGT